MNVAMFIYNSQKLSAGACMTPFYKGNSSSSWRVVAVAEKASLHSRIRSISALVRVRHAMMERPFSAELRCATPSPRLNFSSTIAFIMVPLRYTLVLINIWRSWDHLFMRAMSC
jgi:hypothetical protein